MHAMVLLFQQSWIPRLKNSRWLVLVVSCWIHTVSASANLYSSYSQALKISLQLDQETLTMVSTFAGVGSGFGIVVGYLYNCLPHWVLILAGVAMQSFGFFMLWLAIAHKIHGQVWQLCIYQLFIGAAQSCIQTATIVTSMRNFSSRGAVVGLLKGFQALGASILLQIFSLFFGSDAARLPWMLSLLMPSMILFMPAVRSLPESAPLLLVDVLEVFVAFSCVARLLVCLVIFSFLLSLLTPVFREICSKDEHENDHEPLLPPFSDTEPSNITSQIDLTVTEVLCSLDFWLLFIALVIGFGSTRTANINLAQFAHSLGYTQSMATISVSLFYVCSCWGRIGVGLLSDHCLQKYATPKPVFLMLAMIMISIATGLAAIPVPGALELLTILGGLSEGAHWCLSVAVTSELFGMRTFSVVLNILSLSNPAGSYILSSRVVGYFYDLEAEPGSVLCYGGSCFRTGYAVVSAASIVAGVLIAILARRNQMTKVT